MLIENTLYKNGKVVVHYLFFSHMLRRTIGRGDEGYLEETTKDDNITESRVYEKENHSELNEEFKEESNWELTEDVFTTTGIRCPRNIKK